MRQTDPGRRVGPEEALAAFRQAFGDEHLDNPAELENLIVIASHPVTETARERPLLGALRMLFALGFKREDLIRAVRSGVVGPPIGNPYGDQLTASSRGYRNDLRSWSGIEKADLLWRNADFGWGRWLGLGQPPPTFGIYGTQDFEEGVLIPLGTLGRCFGVKDPFGTGYSEIVQRLAMHVRARLRDHGVELWHSILNTGTAGRLELHPLAREALRMLEAHESPSHVIHFPVQFGLRWRGSSMERAAWHMEHDQPPPTGLVWREFPLPSYAVLCELLVDSYRFVGRRVIMPDCPGDVLVDDAGQLVRRGMSFVGEDDGRVHLVARQREDADARFGTASGLIAV